jgi:hypothetical protein
MDRLPHGYTNHSRRVDGHIEKRYEGDDAVARAEREYICLTGLDGHYPVPEVVRFDVEVPLVVFAELPGRHGQELIEEGHADVVLRLLGIGLAALQSIDPSLIPGLKGTGDVIVHGDFGPQNALFSAELSRITGILDWEVAHLGTPVEDIAWAEWIVRTHHPSAVEALPELFDGSELYFSWSDRQAAMVRQCRHYIAFCDASGLEPAASEWRRRVTITEQWVE